jgi:hypothetical protein
MIRGHIPKYQTKNQTKKRRLSSRENQKPGIDPGEIGVRRFPNLLKWVSKGQED